MKGKVSDVSQGDKTAHEKVCPEIHVPSWKMEWEDPDHDTGLQRQKIHKTNSV